MAERQKELKVKGAVLVALAMVIQAGKDMDWLSQTDLTEEDLKIIRRGIMSSSWYDRALYTRMGTAVYKLAGKNNPELAFNFGHGVLAETLLKIYRGPLVSNEPRELLTKFADFWGTNWFNYGNAEFTSTEKGGTFQITDPLGFPFQSGFLGMMKGVFARMVEESSGKNVKIECAEDKLPDSQQITMLILDIQWE